MSITAAGTAEFRSPDGEFHAEFELREDGILRVASHGHETLASVKQVHGLLEEYRERTGSRLTLLLDATDLHALDPEARDFARKSLGDGSVLQRLSVIGGNLFSRSMFNLYARLAAIPMRVFKTEEPAIAWLKQDTPD